jgi:hypothetical protein
VRFTTGSRNAAFTRVSLWAPVLLFIWINVLAMVVLPSAMWLRFASWLISWRCRGHRNTAGHARGPVDRIVRLSCRITANTHADRPFVHRVSCTSMDRNCSFSP